MHEMLTRYVGSDRETYVEVFDSRREYREAGQLDPRPDRIFLLGQELVPSSGIRVNITNDENFDQVWQAIARQPDLTYLGIPSRFARELTDLPDSLRVLEFTDNDVAKLPAQLALKQVDRLVAGKLRATEAQLSGRAHLSLQLDEKIRAALAANSGLQTLNIQSFRSDSFLLELTCDRTLEQLALRAGKSVTLSPLARFASLKGLWLQQISDEVNLEELMDVAIEELTIGYCRKISGLSRLSKLPLKRLHFFGCGDIGLTPYIAQLEARSLETLSISATR